MMNVIPIRGAKEAPKAERSKMETLQLTPEAMMGWVLPPFQAPLRVNSKVRQIADELAIQTGTPVISGVLTLGILSNDPKGKGKETLYFLDGQHRREAAVESGRKEFLADVRVKMFDTMEEMAAEFLMLNTPISRKKPDDQLRAMQESSKPLQMLQKQCPYIGYRFLRANPDAPILSMAAVLRCWHGAGNETPAPNGTAVNLGLNLTIEDAEQVSQFLQVAFAAWGKDIENARLWSSLNLCILMWLWRVLVLDRDRTGSRRYVVLTVDQFRHCLMAVSADKEYTEWLVGRNTAERDRAPCYRRLRTIFMLRIHREIEGKFKMPQPSWMTN
jgi:hypothetical protein